MFTSKFLRPSLSNLLQRSFSTSRQNCNISALHRLKSLQSKLDQGKIVRGIEVHSGLSALIADKARYEDKSFDFIWSSSLTSSTIKGKPDIEVVDTTQRLQIVEDCLEACALPMIYDGDTGGVPEIFKFTVQKLERLGVSCIIIEDKVGLKQNSLFGTERKQELADPHEFAQKLLVGQKTKSNSEFMIVCRIEALIAGYDVEEALRRARIYVEEGQVNGVMIHSKNKDGKDVLEFLKRFRNEISTTIPVVVVPTSYNSLTEDELEKNGANICIHANHLLRAAYPSMVDVAQSILKHGRTKEIEAEGKVMSVKKILDLIQE